MMMGEIFTMDVQIFHNNVDSADRGIPLVGSLGVIDMNRVGQEKDMNAAFTLNRLGGRY